MDNVNSRVIVYALPLIDYTRSDRPLKKLDTPN